MYVVRRGERFWFRKAVPIDLVDVLGIAEVRRSLRTSNARTARRRALEVLVKVEDVYAVLRSETPLRPARDVALRLLEEAVSTSSGSSTVDQNGRLLRTAADLLRETGDGDVSVGRRPDLSDEAVGRPGIVNLTAHEALDVMGSEAPKADQNRIAVSIVQAVARMARNNLKETAGGARDLDQALAALSSLRDVTATPSVRLPFEQLRAFLEPYLANLRAPVLDAQAVKEILASELRNGLSQAKADEWSGMLLSAAIAKYEAVEVQHRGGAKHQEDVPRRLASFLRAVGDKPIREVSRDDVREYRDLLDQAPDRFVLRFKTDDVREAVGANGKLKRPYNAIKKPTVDLKYLGPVNRLFLFLVKEKLLGSNLAEGIRSAQKEESNAKSKRLPLKPDHINRLLRETVTAPVISATYWVPLIMLFSGARPGEIAQLKVEDLRGTFNGRPHLNLLCLKDDEDEEPDVEIARKPSEDTRRVKTVAGQRLIPIHPMLVKLGLLDLFERRGRDVGPKGQLFRDVAPNQHGHYSAALTKRLNRLLRHMGITNKRFVLYSLRHNFIDACHAAKMPDVTRCKIVGHQMDGMVGVYGNPRPEAWESDWIDKVDFEGLEFEAYLALAKAGKIAEPGKWRKPVRQNAIGRRIERIQSDKTR